jgi:hypothetical protein
VHQTQLSSSGVSRAAVMPLCATFRPDRPRHLSKKSHAVPDPCCHAGPLQMLVVGEKPATAAEEFESRHGVTPPTRDARLRHFRRQIDADPALVEAVERDLLTILAVRKLPRSWSGICSPSRQRGPGRGRRQAPLTILSVHCQPTILATIWMSSILFDIDALVQLLPILFLGTDLQPARQGRFPGFRVKQTVLLVGDVGVLSGKLFFILLIILAMGFLAKE